ncbi:G-patch domain-containing protein [Coniochaeta sp. 2T2.1]|nr:G-patch domain-containing protein [Coniochaeta sp. 2T2.1]
MPSTNPPPPAANADSDSEEDYMKMDFSDPTLLPSTSNKPETSLQRRLRLQREGEARARVKSKAELAAEAEEARERALRTSLLDDEKRKAKSKGFAMMAKMGFKVGGALGRRSEEMDGEGGGKGKDGEGHGDGEGEAEAEGEKEKERARAEPIRIEVKDDRGGIGMESEKKRKLKEAAEEYERLGKKVKADEEGYRERVRREREEARLERLVAAAQKVAERMGEEEEDGAVVEGSGEGRKTKGGVGSRPLKSVNVLWRGLVRQRDEAERDRRMRYDLEQSLSRLPTYEDVDEDEDGKRAMGRSKTVYEVAEDLDEEDPELDQFGALPAEEKLRRLVEHLRREHHYCFWCKYSYPDESMDGCPGLTEEDHD